MKEKQWYIQDVDRHASPVAEAGLSIVSSHLLAQRGFSSPREVFAFLKPDFERDLFDPFLFVDMKKAVERVRLAFEQKEKVVVHGDYDADGVCSSALLVSTLRLAGLDVDVYLPHREREGYGLNQETVRTLADSGARLIITTDCGITSVREVALARELGVDVIITDHHQPPPELPRAFAIINPQVKTGGYPYADLCGTGVAYKLACALAAEFPQIDEPYRKWLLDLVALATIADCMTLQGENRALVTYGLIVLGKTRRPGLRELLRLQGIEEQKMKSFHVGWRIAPVINAVGRLGHSRLAYDLLMTEDRVEAQKLAVRLLEINQERKKITGTVVTEARQQIGVIDGQKILFAYDATWSIGVVGLAAGKIANEYSRPTFVMGGNNGRIVGSGRSIPGVNITAILRQSESWLAKFGGHEQACGFTLKDGADFQQWQAYLRKIIDPQLPTADLQPRLMIDLEVDLVDIHEQLIEELELFEPFGEGNREPIFLARDISVAAAEVIGAEGKHLRLRITGNNNRALKAIAFGFGQWGEAVVPGARVDLVFVPEMNHWNGSSELQLRVVDLDLAGEREVFNSKKHSQQLIAA